FDLTKELSITDNPSISKKSQTPTKVDARGYLALNIVHAVEFSRNGRTRFSADLGASSEAVSFISSGHPEGRVRMHQAPEISLFEAWNVPA
ncbi:hypothetical protein J7E25_15075, partial [Agromyces sp. ISL-38]|uniref:hypothetical protein n=1 Tax=Agromyces sp. ISL-38 TaxID=2819107 RepID=UPI001BEBAC85